MSPSDPAWRGRAPARPCRSTPRWLGLNASERCTSVAGSAVVAIGRVAEVVLHVAAAGVDRSVDCPGTRRRCRAAACRTTLASTLSRPRCAMPMTTLRTPWPTARSISELEQRRCSLSAPSTQKRFAPRNLVCEELLERLRLDDLLEEPRLASGSRAARGCASAPSAARASRAGLGVVHVRELDAERAAVGLLEPRRARASDTSRWPSGSARGRSRSCSGEPECRRANRSARW